MGTSLRYKLGWSILLTFMVSKSDSVLVRLNVTNHLFDRLVSYQDQSSIRGLYFRGIDKKCTFSYHQQTGKCRSVLHEVCRLYTKLKVRGPKWKLEGVQPKCLPSLPSMKRPLGQLLSEIFVINSSQTI